MTMQDQSDSVAELAKALAKAQGQIEGAKKDSVNPHFRSSYADLASVWDACRVPLSANGLAVTQTTEAGDRDGVIVVTTLMHASGEWKRGRLYMPNEKGNAQGMGSAITYGRRYGLAAMVGIAPEDDDGEAATGRQSDDPRKAARSQKPTQSQNDAPSDDMERKAVLAQIRDARSTDELDAIGDSMRQRSAGIRKDQEIRSLFKKRYDELQQIPEAVAEVFGDVAVRKGE